MKKSTVLLFLTLLPSLLLANVVTDRVTRVIDGDTVVLDSIGKARLIGVDTPETVHPQKAVEEYGKEASDFTRRILEGKTVRVDFDWQKTDKYQRTLVYLYLEDSTFFNAELVKQGFAHAYTKYPFKYLDQFRDYERQARENNRGLWSIPAKEVSFVLAQNDNEDQTVYITRTGSKYHRGSCRYLSKSKIPISLKEAAARYTPCSVCQPPTLSTQKATETPAIEENEVKGKQEEGKQEEAVYITRTGECYHQGWCSSLRKSKIPVTKKEAIKRGYRPCSRCNP